MKEIRTSYLKALNGEVEILQIDFPEELNKEIVFKTKKELVKAELENFLQFCIQYETRHQKINPRDPNFSVGMEEAFSSAGKNY